MWEITSAWEIISVVAPSLTAAVAIILSIRANRISKEANALSSEALSIGREANELSAEAFSVSQSVRESDEAPRLALASERLYRPTERYEFVLNSTPISKESVSIGRMPMRQSDTDIQISPYAIILNSSKRNCVPEHRYDNFAEIDLQNVGFDMQSFVLKRALIHFSKEQGSTPATVLELVSNYGHNTFNGPLLRNETVPFLVSYWFDSGTNELIDRTQDFDEIIREKIRYANGNLFMVPLPRRIDMYCKLVLEFETENTKGVRYSQTVTLEIIDKEYRPSAGIPEIISSD